MFNRNILAAQMGLEDVKGGKAEWVEDGGGPETWRQVNMTKHTCCTKLEKTNKAKKRET